MPTNYMHSPSMHCKFSGRIRCKTCQASENDLHDDLGGKLTPFYFHHLTTIIEFRNSQTAACPDIGRRFLPEKEKKEEKAMLVKMAISRPNLHNKFQFMTLNLIKFIKRRRKKNATSIKSRHRFRFTVRLSLAICHSRRQKYKFYTRKHFSLWVQLCQFRRYQHSSIELHVICVCNIKILSPSHPQRWTWGDAFSRIPLPGGRRTSEKQ